MSRLVAPPTSTMFVTNRNKMDSVVCLLLQSAAAKVHRCTFWDHLGPTIDRSSCFVHVRYNHPRLTNEFTFARLSRGLMAPLGTKHRKTPSRTTQRTAKRQLKMRSLVFSRPGPYTTANLRLHAHTAREAWRWGMSDTSRGWCKVPAL